MGCQAIPSTISDAAMKMHRDDGFTVVQEDLAALGPRGGHSGTRTAPSLVQTSGWGVLNVNVTLRPSHVCKVQKSSQIWSLICAGSFSIKGQAAPSPAPPPHCHHSCLQENMFHEADAGNLLQQRQESTRRAGVGVGRVSPAASCEAEFAFTQPRTSRRSGHALLLVCMLCWLRHY